MHLIALLSVLIAVNMCFVSNAIEIPEHMRAMAKKLHNACQTETGVPDELLKASTNGKLPNDRALQCYMHCLFDKVGLIDEEHVVHLENIIDLLPTELQPIVENLVKVCGTKHGADGCETAYLTVQCYFDAEPATFKNELNFMFE